MPTFDSLSARKAENPEQTYALITRLLEANLAPNVTDRITTDQDTYVTVLSGITHAMFFPLPPENDGSSWKEYRQTIQMIDKSMDVIERACNRVDGLFFRAGNIPNQLLTRLLDICCIFDIWSQLQDEADSSPQCPSLMMKKAHSVMVTVLRTLGEYVSPASAQNLMWEMLRVFFVEVLNALNDLTSHSAALTPVTLQFFKSSEQLQVKSPFSITLETIDGLKAFLIHSLHLVSTVLCLPFFSHLFLTDFTRIVPETTRIVFDFCLSPALSIDADDRIALLNQLSINAKSLWDTYPDFCGPLRSMQFSLLQYTVRESRLSRLKNVPTLEGVPCSKTDLLSALDMLQHSQSIESTGLLVSFLRANIPHADCNVLDRTQVYIEQFCPSAERDSLTSVLEVRRSLLLSKSSNPPVDSWSQKAQKLLSDLLFPAEVMWPEDTSQEQVVESVLQQIHDHFERSDMPASSSERAATASHLADLTCHLAGCIRRECTTLDQKQAMKLLPPCYGLVESILQGPDEIITSHVRREAYRALTSILRHHDQLQVCNEQNQALECIMSGVVNQDRSVRLSAGNALASCLQLFALSNHNLEPLFERIYHCYERAPLSAKETIIISIGTMGKSTHQELRSQCICFLVAQLGSQYPPLKGSASMKLDGLKQLHGRSLNSMLGHHIDRVAPFLVSNYCIHPGLLHEACRLMATSTTAFISMTRAATYPSLFANCNLRVLQKIAKEQEVPLSGLFFPDSARILAHIYQLPESGQTKRAMDFIEKTVITDNISEGAKIPIHQLIKMSLVPLLAELVVGLGVEQQAELSMAALNKIAGLAPTFEKAKYPKVPALGTFLNDNALGVISHLSDMLQDTRSKAPLARKRAVLKGMGALATTVGSSISPIAPQYMSIFQTTILIPELTEASLRAWHTFLITLDYIEVGPYVGLTTSLIVSVWPNFSAQATKLATQLLNYIIMDAGTHLGEYLDNVVDLSPIPELRRLQRYMTALRCNWSPQEHLSQILHRSSSDNQTVALQGLKELKSFMTIHQRNFINQLLSGDTFDPLAGRIVEALLVAACRDFEGNDALRILAFELMGTLGAADPDRFELHAGDSTMIVLSNYADDEEAIIFALHLIKDLLVGVFRATSDVAYQKHLGYTIQQLLKVCHFTPALITTGAGHSAPVKVRNRWNNLPKDVVETVSPLLDSKYSVNTPSTLHLQHPIYPTQSTYRDWMQLWACHLITRTTGGMARNIFSPFYAAARNKDVTVAYHILPHLVLNVLLSGNENDLDAIRQELLSVLDDQVSTTTESSADKRLLSAQAVFVIMDHLNRWVRLIRQEISMKKAETKRSRASRVGDTAEEQLLRVDSILSSIDQSLMAKAALQCKAYARALMNFEAQIIALQERGGTDSDMLPLYEHLHEMYACLDEPDGMEGISTLILSPSLEHQIRQHESTGRWTSAQSCWEVRLQQSPENLDYHIGLLRCLRNLGHYDTLRTHVRGVLVRNPEWESPLVDFHVESAWMVGAWQDVQSIVGKAESQTTSTVIARLLLALRDGQSQAIEDTLAVARSVLGAPLISAGIQGYRRAYDAVVNLHLTHELHVIFEALSQVPTGSQTQANSAEVLAQLSNTLTARFDSISPAFRIRETVLSLRRTTLSLFSDRRPVFAQELGRSWLLSAKIARKARHQQTAYSALLQAKQVGAKFSFIESAKLVQLLEQPLRAVQELEKSMKFLGMTEESQNVLDLTEDEQTKHMKAKAQILRARWMNESGRFDISTISKTFQKATRLRPNWESGHFHVGQYYDDCYKNMSHADQLSRGLKMTQYAVKEFTKAARDGSKYVYQTIPRVLTIWLDLGEEKQIPTQEPYRSIHEAVSKAVEDVPAYKWFTAFPQIVSRVGHTNDTVYKVLSKLITKVLEEYPKQALWLFASVVESNKPNRAERGKQILDQIRSSPSNAKKEVPGLVDESLSMARELLRLCNYVINDDNKKTLAMRDFPRLAALGKSRLIIPLQESLTANLPSSSQSESVHQPFPPNAPTFEGFHERIEIMRSLAKPRKLTITGSDGQEYMFLGKPKDDLRKDARLMDLNAIINKLLKANSESRRRQLRIRTYGVVTLNEECGFIQWVPNTIPVRPVLMRLYDSKRIKSWSNEMHEVFKRIKELDDKHAAEMFAQQILTRFPPVFHEWFAETFPEPSAWLASRLAYGRTAAVMSMVGFVLGLGDRHCENILLDANTGDAVHVDFNCLFDKGKTLETPERVPFRLTQNIVDGFGVTGVEGGALAGVFRLASEVTLQLLRDHKDSLMSVLDAFVHDPLVEWEDERRRMERNRRNQVKNAVDLKMVAKTALLAIEKRLKGIHSTGKERQEKEYSTSNLVQVLIQDATDMQNLAKMYPGWAAWH